MVENNVNFNPDRPKLVFEKEYSTTWMQEVKWLDDHGIRYSFVKEVDGKTVYKYKKTVALFASIADFCRTKSMYE